MDLLSMLLGVVGTLLTLWVAIVGKQLQRSRLEVDVGFFGSLFEGPKRRWFAAQARRVDAIAVGAASEVQMLVFPLAIHIRNTGSVPVSDVEVVAEFPESVLVAKDAVFGPVNGKLAKLGGVAFPRDRETACFQRVAQSRVPIGMIRPGQVVVTGELLQLHTGLMTPALRDPGRSEILDLRYSACQQLRALVEVRISVWSSSLRPISISVPLLWFDADSQAALEEGIHRMVRATAEAAPMAPGLYIQLPWIKLQRDELIELVLLRLESIEDVPRAVTFDGVSESVIGASSVRLPPWGFWGESFDVSRWLLRRSPRAEGGHA